MKFLFLILFMSVQAFSEDVSDRELKELALNLINSQSEEIFNGRSLKLNKHILVLDIANGSYTTIYAGRRQQAVTPSTFKKEMVKHIRHVKRIFENKGLVHYSFVVTNDYEIAVQTWETKAAADIAFASSEAAEMRVHGNSILKHVVFEEVR